MFGKRDSKERDSFSEDEFETSDNFPQLLTVYSQMDSNLFIGIIENEHQIDDQTSHALAFRDNKIGGHPVLSPKSSQTLINCFNSLVCDSCQTALRYVLQVYGPVDNSATDRLVFLFVCLNCSPNKWFAIRTITPLLENETKEHKINNKSDVWVDGQENWGEEDMEEDIDIKTNTCANFFANLSVNCSEDSQRCSSIAVNSFSFFRPLYISVIEEPDNRETEDKHIKSLVDTYQRTGENKCGSSAEVYEQNFLESIYRNDRKNYEFFKRLSICPNQVIRYQWMGMPLVNSDNHRLEVSKCQLCGADRTFEFQLMPALITYLKPLANSGIISDLDFGTVLVFTCARNCKPSNDSFASEQIIVLSDPDNEIVDKIKIK